MPNIKQQTSNVSEKGIVLYLALLLLSSTLATALFVSTIFVKELQIAKEVTDSMNAVYVADSTMEYTLFQTRVQGVFAVPFTTITDLDSVTSTGYELSVSACAPQLNLGVAGDITCQIGAVRDLKKTLNIVGCPSSTTAADCTRIVSRGSYKNASRAIEIVYPNL